MRHQKKIVISLAAVLLFLTFTYFQHSAPISQQAAVTAALPVSTAPFSTASTPDRAVAASPSNYYSVVSVVDGDTFKVAMGNATETIRLIGIDTPETKDPRKPVQCFGREASAKAHFILDGHSVRLEADSSQNNRDKYGRLLRYAYLLDGTFFNKLMIEEGYAHEYTYDIPYQFQSEFKAAEQSARENARGLWAPTTCTGNTKKAATTK